MQDSKFPSRNDNYAQLAQHLLNSESPLSYSLEYLLDNYGERAIPAMLQALPVRPWHEQQLILEALGKLGDLNAIEPICALLYGGGKSVSKLEQSVINTLRKLVYYCPDKKKATNILLELMIRYKQCVYPLTVVLKEQNSKYALKISYKKLFKQQKNRADLQESAITIVGEENELTSYRIKVLKKILYRASDEQLRDRTINALKVLISKKRCQQLCSKKGMKFDAFFRRPESDCYDCCCIGKDQKRVLIKFEGSLISGKTMRNKPAHSERPNIPNSMRVPTTTQKNSTSQRNKHAQ